MVKLSLRRPSALTLSGHSRSLGSGHSRRSRRSSAESENGGLGSEDGSIGGSDHTATISHVSPAVIKPTAHAHHGGGGRGLGSLRRFSSLRGSNHSGKGEHGGGRGGGLRKSLSFKKKKGGGGKKTTFLLHKKHNGHQDEVDGKPSATLLVGGQSYTHASGQRRYYAQGGRRGSAAPTVATMGTAASNSMAAAAAAAVTSLENLEEDGSVTAAAQAFRGSPMGTGRRASATRPGGRRATLNSIPDGILADLHNFADDGDDDQTIGDRSDCSDLSGLTGQTGLTAGGGANPAISGNGGSGRRRGSVTRPAAMGRRRSSLCKIPDGIALVHMSPEDLAELDDSGGDLGESTNLNGSSGELSWLGASSGELNQSMGKMTLGKELTEGEDGIVLEEEQEGESSPQDDSAVPQSSSLKTAEVEPQESVLSKIQSLDHRLLAQRAADRRAMFEPSGAYPPAFPALADFVASLSHSPPVVTVTFDNKASTSPQAPSFLEEADLDRVAPLATSRSVLDDLVRPKGTPPTEQKGEDEGKEGESSLSSVLDRIQSSAATTTKSSTKESAVDRLLDDYQDKKKKSRTSQDISNSGMSALDRLLAPPPPSERSALDRLLAPPSTGPTAIDRLLAPTTQASAAAAAAAPQEEMSSSSSSSSADSPAAAEPLDAASRASSAIDRILRSRNTTTTTTMGTTTTAVAVGNDVNRNESVGLALTSQPPSARLSTTMSPAGTMPMGLWSLDKNSAPRWRPKLVHNTGPRKFQPPQA